MASVSTKGSQQWHASINVWHADSALPKGGRWKWTWKATGIPATEPQKVAQKVADALQDAASSVHPSNLRRGDQRAFVEALGQNLAGRRLGATADHCFIQGVHPAVSGRL